MLEKPFILSLLLTIFSFLLSIPLSFIDKIMPQTQDGMFCCFLSVIIISFLIGLSHARKYKKNFSTKEKLKIALYYFILNFPFVLSIVLFFTANTTVKGVPPYNIFVTILVFNILYMFLTLSFFVYILLDVGGITWLKYKKIEIQTEEDTRFNILLKTPLFLSLILLFITYFINSIIPVSSMFVKDPFSPTKLCVVAFLAAICIGFKKDKIQTIDKVKIALYTFLFYNAYVIFILLVSHGKAIINSITFFDPPYLLHSFQILVLNLVAAASIYIGVSVGKEIKILSVRRNLVENK